MKPLLCRESDLARFTKQTSATSNGCLVWTGPVNKDGYGLFSLDGKYELAHRVSWQWVHGPIPTEVCVLHECDNPPCVLATHLFTGSQQDNVADKVAKNRQAKHERNGQAKLTLPQAQEIRALYREEEFSLSDLAERFGVSKRAILFVIQGKTWR